VAWHGGVDIVIVENTLYIFPAGMSSKIEVNLFSYKYKYFPFISGIDNVIAFRETRNCYINSTYPYISASLHARWVTADVRRKQGGDIIFMRGRREAIPYQP
jgi:hypothetical protein